MDPNIDEVSKEYRLNQKELVETTNRYHHLLDQMKENELVLDELQKVKEGEEVYKLIGSVLVKQDTDESITNVKKRMEFMSNSLKILDEKIKSIENKRQECQKKLYTLKQHTELEHAVLNGSNTN